MGIKWEKRSKISKQKKKEENNLWCWGVYSLTEDTQAQYCRTTKKNTSQDKWTQYRVSVSKEKTIFLVKVRLNKDKSVLKIIPPNLAFFEGCNKSLGNEISFVLFCFLAETPLPLQDWEDQHDYKFHTLVRYEIQNFKRPEVYISTKPEEISMACHTLGGWENVIESNYNENM